MSRTFHHGATRAAAKSGKVREIRTRTLRRTSTRQAVVAAAIRGDL
ncbi:MAG TPA: hypothetical protein VLZ78_04045 [Terrimesophilobacter sp.]|nr:hypothetical protein [Terrimesophilobacter sp.]